MCRQLSIFVCPLYGWEDAQESAAMVHRQSTSLMIPLLTKQMGMVIIGIPMYGQLCIIGLVRSPVLLGQLGHQMRH